MAMINIVGSAAGARASRRKLEYAEKRFTYLNDKANANELTDYEQIEFDFLFQNQNRLSEKALDAFAISDYAEVLYQDAIVSPQTALENKENIEAFFQEYDQSVLASQKDVFNTKAKDFIDAFQEHFKFSFKFNSESPKIAKQQFEDILTDWMQKNEALVNEGTFESQIAKLRNEIYLASADPSQSLSVQMDSIANLPKDLRSEILNILNINDNPLSAKQASEKLKNLDAVNQEISDKLNAVSQKIENGIKSDPKYNEGLKIIEDHIQSLKNVASETKNKNLRDPQINALKKLITLQFSSMADFQGLDNALNFLNFNFKSQQQYEQDLKQRTSQIIQQPPPYRNDDAPNTAGEKMQLRDGNVPHNENFMQKNGLNGKYLYADYEFLLGKHPEYFNSQNHVRAAVEFVLNNPERVQDVSNNMAFVRKDDESGTIFRIEINPNIQGNANHIRSAHIISNEKYEKIKVGKRTSDKITPENSVRNENELNAGENPVISFSDFYNKYNTNQEEINQNPQNSLNFSQNNINQQSQFSQNQLIAIDEFNQIQNETSINLFPSNN